MHETVVGKLAVYHCGLSLPAAPPSGLEDCLTRGRQSDPSSSQPDRPPLRVIVVHLHLGFELIGWQDWRIVSKSLINHCEFELRIGSHHGSPFRKKIIRLRLILVLAMRLGLWERPDEGWGIHHLVKQTRRETGRARPKCAATVNLAQARYLTLENRATPSPVAFLSSMFVSGRCRSGMPARHTALWKLVCRSEVHSVSDRSWVQVIVDAPRMRLPLECCWSFR